MFIMFTGQLAQQTIHVVKTDSGLYISLCLLTLLVVCVLNLFDINGC